MKPGEATLGRAEPWPAPGKLNLFLHVVGRRADGYHLLQTAFQFIDLCDEIGFWVRPPGVVERVGEVPCAYIVERGLKVGDYSVSGMEELITIERKSVPDLFGSLGKGRRRMEKRFDMMKDVEWAGLMIEGCEDRVMRKQDYSTMSLNQIYHAISSVEIRGIHVYYAKKREDAKDWILSRLTRFYNHVRRGDYNGCVKQRSES